MQGMQGMYVEDVARGLISTATNRLQNGVIGGRFRLLPFFSISVVSSHSSQFVYSSSARCSPSSGGGNRVLKGQSRNAT
jgi:hypothetical protein